MRRTKTSILPSVEVMEPRLLLSIARPLLSKHATSGVVREVRAIVSTLAKTQDTVQASTQLTGLSSHVPSGPEGLAPSWQSDVGLYRPHSARSIAATQKRLIGDLYRFIQRGLDSGNQPVSGPGSTPTPTPGHGTVGTGTPTPTPTPGHGTVGTPTPVPMPSLDSVRIQNTTGLALVVTVHLKVSQFQQPRITETISAQANSTVLFDFGTATNVFMTMDVSRADRGQSPTPFDNIDLSQPLSGYNGALYTISLLGPYFNVTFY
jgi:hypothetical protein